MNESKVFPRDLETLRIIKEMEKENSLPYKCSDEMSDIELVMYINELENIEYRE